MTATAPAAVGDAPPPTRTPALDGDRLVDAAGDVRVGVFDRPIRAVNHRDYRLTDPFGRARGRLARHFAYTQFQFMGAVSETLVFGCAMADTRWAGTVFVYCWEPRTGRYEERTFKRPLGLGLRFDDAPEDGTTAFASGANRVTMTAEGAAGTRRLDVALADGVRIEARFDETRPPIQPMWIATRAGATGWVYARKTAGVPVTGTLAWGDRRVDLGAAGARGHVDWSAGFMRRETFWNWGCLSGTLADGRSIGMNVSCGVNETSFTENCFWLDGVLHKVDTVAFDYDRRDLVRPWRLRSGDDRVALEFTPEGQHVESLNAWVVATDFHQLFGRYRGRLTTAAGVTVPIDGVLGYAESHYARW